MCKNNLCKIGYGLVGLFNFKAKVVAVVSMALLQGFVALYAQGNTSYIEAVNLYSVDSVFVVRSPKLIEINNDVNSIEFVLTEFEGCSYALVRSNSDTVWKNLASNIVFIDFLQYGKYSFLIKNSQEKVQGVSILVKLNWVHYILILIGALALGYGFFVYHSWSLIKANRIYKQKEITSIEVARQKEELAVKNKNITDSINYARRIQLAMIPSIRYFKNIFPESFVFFKPKDIVSGDFFWIAEKKDKIFVAAVDCTGHGVPGAFMSIIGIELLRKIINGQGIEEPSEVLDELNKNFADIFKDVENITLRDGMDIAFCVIDKGSRILEYAGAFNPLYLVRENKLTEIKGDRFSVGLEDYEGEMQSFTNHHIQLMKDDMVYIFTDGYSDQFGGPEGKKFKYRRFRHLLLNVHEAPIDDQLEQLERSIDDWMGDSDQVDDILVIGMKISF